MGLIPEEIVQKVRDHTDVVELVGRSVGLKRAGRNHKGLCPFHDEKTPSFNVNPDRQSYFCFGCQEGGDVFSFLMKTENLTFAEAVRTLAADCGIEVPETAGGEQGLAERLFEANALAQSRYRALLAEPDNPGAAYLAERGLEPDTIARFGLGFVPDRWDTVARALEQAGIPAELGERAGLLSRGKSGKPYDRLRGRVVFPIQDPRGRFVGFGGRALAAGQEPKYLNTPESPIFRKRAAFYGFPFALEPIRRSERAVVVEGYFDRIALHRAGIEGCVATCGTALTAEHGRQLRRRTGEVVLLFDGDEAGQSAVERSLEVLLPERLRVRAVLLPPGDDPDSFLAREGAESLRKLVDDAPSALDLVIRRAVAGGCSAPWEKADAVARVAPLLARLPSAVERAGFCERLGLAVGCDARHVEEAVRRAARGEDARDAIPIAPRRSGPAERNLRQLALCLIEHPELGRRVPGEGLERLLGPGALAEVVEALLAVSGPLDLEAVAAQLGDEARTELRALAVSDRPLDADAAARTVDDTLRWFRKQQIKQEKQAQTRRMRDPDADMRTLLEEKQRLLEKRRRLISETSESPTLESPKDDGGSQSPVGPVGTAV